MINSDQSCGRAFLDRSETKNVDQNHHEVVSRLQAAAEVGRNDLGDKLSDRKGNGARPHAAMTESDLRLKWVLLTKTPVVADRNQ